jgi:hypothetical protein
MWQLRHSNFRWPDFRSRQRHAANDDDDDVSTT